MMFDLNDLGYRECRMEERAPPRNVEDAILDIAKNLTHLTSVRHTSMKTDTVLVNIILNCAAIAHLKELDLNDQMQFIIDEYLPPSDKEAVE